MTAGQIFRSRVLQYRKQKEAQRFFIEKMPNKLSLEDLKDFKYKGKPQNSILSKEILTHCKQNKKQQKQI